MLTRERPRSPIVLPPPASLPSLRDALRRRAAIFGPVEANRPRAAPRGRLARLGDTLRDVADLLDPSPAVPL